VCPFRPNASLNSRLFSRSVIIFRESLAAKYLGLMMKYSGWKFFSSDDFDRDALRALSALPADRLAGVGAALKTPRFVEWCGLYFYPICLVICIAFSAKLQLADMIVVILHRLDFRSPGRKRRAVKCCSHCCVSSREICFGFLLFG
jgi:hypothetical protein